MHPAPQSSGISGLVTGLDSASHQPVPYISSLSIPSPGTRTPHTVDTVSAIRHASQQLNTRPYKELVIFQYTLPADPLL